MRNLPLILLFTASLVMTGCRSNETKPSEPPPAPPPVAAAPEPAPPPSKPECPPEPTGKKKATKKSSKKAEIAAPVDCEPAKPKNAANEKAEKPAPEPVAPAPAKESTSGKACNPCTVKSKDGSFDGEVYGSIPSSSKWARLQIGMHQSEVERIIGVSHNVRAYVTGKAFIPFYYGSDRHRYEVVYPGQGSVAYTGGSFGGGMGILMMINYDAKVQ